MIDFTGKKELFFTDEKVIPTIEEWKKQGRPIVWLKVYDKDNIVIWEDRAYARIKLITPEGEAIGWDSVSVKDIAAHNSICEDEGIVAYVPYKRIR